MPKSQIRQFILRHSITRNLFFFFFHKKANKRRLNKKIDNYKLSTIPIDDNLIVSLTSFPARIEEVQYTVYSMLTQSVLPQKIILWLAEEQFKNKELDLPERLLSLRNEIFEIRWCTDIRSYKKLIPAIKEFGGKNIVICDDDIFYRKHTLKKLIECHKEHPQDVICHIGQQMCFSEDKLLLPYTDWNQVKQCFQSKNVLPIGGGTVLYPSIILQNSPLLLREDLFREIAFYADDIWFWFSVVSAGFAISIPKQSYKSMIYVNPEREYGISNEMTLAKINEGKDMNDQQLKQLEKYLGKTIWQFLQK